MNPRIASFVILFFIFKIIGDVNCGCQLSLKTDFNKNSPVFLQDNKYLTPDSIGDISVQRSGTILIACPGKKSAKIILDNSNTSYNVLVADFNPTPSYWHNYNKTEAHCVTNKTFRVDRWIGTFDKIRCSVSPEFVSHLTPRTCIHGGNIHELGYEINGNLYPLYEICFDDNLLTTYFVKHELLPTSLFMQTGNRPNFIEGTMFNKVKMSKIYKIENQKSRLDTILGQNMSDIYVSKTQYLNRGHLAARADYTLRAEQRATFHYANTAPQWQRGNSGDWAALEDALRRRVHRLGRSVTVYTGTHDVLTLPDSTGAWQPIYLYSDENNNGLVPVPLYFYKLVYDKQTKNATAFTSINTSFYNSSRTKELTFCDDLCTESEFSWLKWRPDGTHSFCCDYEQFENKIGRLHDFDVYGPFY